MTQSTQPKNTPGRRRQGRNNNNTNTITTTTNNNSNRKTPQKMYASENDILPYKKNSPYASPCTPQRPGASGGDLSPLLQTGSTNPKQRNKSNRNRNNHGGGGGGGAMSPGHQKQNRPSPPILPQQESTPAIFAGSTFHASPAPSALPMPSFFTSSHSDSPTVKSAMGPGQEPSPPCTDSEDAPSPPPVPWNEESPLEFFFRADRAEKARTHRANSITVLTSGPISPPRDSPQLQNTVPRVATSNQAGRHPVIPQRNMAPGISVNELDGTPGQPLGPAFSTPYQQRIRAARSGSDTAQITPAPSQNHDLDPSDALKRYLFHGQLDSSPPLASPKQQQALRRQQSPKHFTPRKQPPQKAPQQLVAQPPSPPEQQMPEHQSLPRGMFPASVLGDYSSTIRSKMPVETVSTSPQRPDNIITMEDSLRRMLKLSPSN